jgi:hypothetical protein
MKKWHPTDEPVTQWVMAACAKAADDNKQAWVESSWESGQADQAALSEFRTRADAYRALEETNFEGWMATHGQDEEGSND